MEKINLETIKDVLIEFIDLNKLKTCEIKGNKISVEEKSDLEKLIAFFIYKFGYEVNLNIIDVSKVDCFNHLFARNKTGTKIKIDKNTFVSINLGLFNGFFDEWDTSSAKFMMGMFENSIFNCHKINFNVRNVESMNNMFFKARYDKGIDFIDVPNLKTVYSMFRKATILSPINLDLCGVENARNLFEEATIESIDLLNGANFNFESKSNDIDLGGMFAGLKAINKLNPKEEENFANKLIDFIENKIKLNGKNLTLEQQADSSFRFFQNIISWRTDLKGMEVYLAKHYIEKAFKDEEYLNKILENIDKKWDSYSKEYKDRFPKLVLEKKESEKKNVNKDEDVLVLFFKQMIINQDKIPFYFKEKYKDYFVYLGVDNFKDNEKSLTKEIKI